MSSKVTAVVVCSTLIDAALFAWILFRGRGSRIDLSRALLAAVALCVSMAVKFAFARIFGATSFLAISFAYVNTFVLVPLASVAVLVASRRREVAKSVRVLAWASFAVVPIGIYATFVEPYTLRTERAYVSLSPSREGRTPITIAVLSDIQCVEVTDRERDAVRRAMDAEPDLVLLPGDLVQVGTHRLDEIRDDFRALVAPLAAPLGVYFVQGNCETKEDARYLLEGTPVKILDDEIVEGSVRDRHVRVCGVDLAFASRRAREVLRAIETESSEGDVCIVVAHRPDVIGALSHRSRVDLVVAGHTHGGQVQLPLFGPPITLSDVPRAVAAGGLHELDGKRIYVSRGIGWEHGQAPRVRFLCPPEVSLVTLGG
jgi:predicted MPP superfamily phosphohydrolase